MAVVSRVPEQSPVSKLIANKELKSASGALSLEVLHNLQHQHSWQDLQLHSLSQLRGVITPAATQSNAVVDGASHSITLISGLPPKHSYVHPDLQTHLIKHKIPEISVPVQREWVLPMSIGEKWSLKQFCGVFDALPEREAMKEIVGLAWTDTKRVLLGMVSHNGRGGDGTVVYYIMQEGEVKPRQNG